MGTRGYFPGFACCEHSINLINMCFTGICDFVHEKILMWKSTDCLRCSSIGFGCAVTHSSSVVAITWPLYIFMFGFICVTMAVSQPRVAQLAPVKQGAVLGAIKLWWALVLQLHAQLMAIKWSEWAFCEMATQGLMDQLRFHWFLGSARCDPAWSGVYQGFCGGCFSIISR